MNAILTFRLTQTILLAKFEFTFKAFCLRNCIWTTRKIDKKAKTNQKLEQGIFSNFHFKTGIFRPP